MLGWGRAAWPVLASERAAKVNWRFNKRQTFSRWAEISNPFNKVVCRSEQLQEVGVLRRMEIKGGFQAGERITAFSRCSICIWRRRAAKRPGWWRMLCGASSLWKNAVLWKLCAFGLLGKGWNRHRKNSPFPPLPMEGWSPVIYIISASFSSFFACLLLRPFFLNTVLAQSFGILINQKILSLRIPDK